MRARRVVLHQQHFGLCAAAAHAFGGGVEHGLNVLFHAAFVVAQLPGRGAGGIQLTAPAWWRLVAADDHDLAVAEHDGVGHPPPSPML
jgi:hypothetical protein